VPHPQSNRMAAAYCKGLKAAAEAATWRTPPSNTPWQQHIAWA
jgi:hypothetical protein